MNLKFYNYDQCFNYYTKRIDTIKQARIKGELILAKPILLLAIIDCIEEKHIQYNRIRIDEILEQKYNALMSKYARGSQFDNPTKIEYPFWHLQTDGFWHFCGIAQPKKMNVSATKKFLTEQVKFAYFDNDLWMLLTNDATRIALRNYIVETKLSNGSSLKELVGKIACYLPLLWQIAG